MKISTLSIYKNQKHGSFLDKKSTSLQKPFVCFATAVNSGAKIRRSFKTAVLKIYNFHRFFAKNGG